jgi:hypothetical protein
LAALNDIRPIAILQNWASCFEPRIGRWSVHTVLSPVNLRPLEQQRMRVTEVEAKIADHGATAPSRLESPPLSFVTLSTISEELAERLWPGTKSKWR